MPFDCITSQLERMNGQPCVRGSRLTGKRVLAIVAAYRSREEIKRDFPELDDEDIVQALGYAGAMLDDAVVVLPSSV